MSEPKSFEDHFNEQTQGSEGAALGEHLWDGAAKAFGFEDGEHMKVQRQNKTTMELQDRYKGQPGTHGFDEDGEPYYEVSHPSGWKLRSWGGPYLDVMHKATGDDMHDAIDVGHYTDRGHEIHPAMINGSPEGNHAMLQRELHSFINNHGQDYADNLPQVRRWQQARRITNTAAIINPRTAALRKNAHDSGDGETIYHCPFCGSGQVLARSDRTIECEFCHTCFTVQVQPQFAAFPQTIDGQPVDVPGMPGQIGAPADQAPPMDPSGNPMADPTQDPDAAGGAPPFGADGQSDDADPEGEGEDTEDDDDDKKDSGGGNPFAKGSMRATAGVCSGSGERKNVSRSSMRSKEPGSQAKVADISCSECGRRFTTRANDKTREATVPRHSEGKTSSLRNGRGMAMTPAAYMARLALLHTDNREATLAKIRAGRD